MTALWRTLVRYVAPWLPHAGAVLALLVSMAVAKSVYDRKQREIGRLQERLRTWEVDLKVVRDSLKRLEGVRARVDTQYVADTTGLRRREHVWREAYAALRHRLDLGPDSVPYPVEVVREVIVQADSVIGQCLAAVATGEQRLSVCDAARERQAAQIRLLESRPQIAPRGRVATWGERALCLGIGYGVGRWSPR